ncbi:MAG: tRNA (cytidine(34)-2'-O)-methyltransferase [Rhodocyclaceae bacterium]|nr:tRNA (cytidine(34)-2'-O)-methyltransferase [Rhodocyclaceae bacterium]
MFHIILYQPEIPPNTGNIVRLCANAGATLHLVKPLGFSLSERALRRAGMDYAEFAAVRIHEDWPACLAALRGTRLFACTTRGGTRHDAPAYADGDAFVFGPETRGLPRAMLDGFPPERRLRIPMVAGSRSINLSNATAVVLYEAWRQAGFAGAG